MFISRGKIILCSFLLVLFTALGTAGIFAFTFPGGPNAAARLWSGMQIVSSNYYEATDSNQLVNGALQGMIKSLGDPYSSYMDAKTVAQFSDQMEGSFSGVGIVLGKKEDDLVVISPIEGTPGERAGVKPGDFIRKINGEDTQTFSTEDAANRIRGPVGTSVTLTLERPSKEKGGASETIEVVLVRENIKIQTVSGKMLEGDIGYVRLTSFNKESAADFKAKLAELDKLGMRRLVLDLRNNPGGLLDSSVDITGTLLKEGEVVSTVGRNGVKTVSRSGGKTDRYDSLVVLINEGSASASEIVAGAVQDRHEGTLVGTKSFGKGSVQVIYPLSESPQTAVRLTIAKYYTPSGRSIHGTGLQPDTIVEWSGEGPAGAVDTDPQLKKALEVLQEKSK